MQIVHIALWTRQLDVLREFYVRYFDGTSSSRYENVSKGFESYFVRFGEGCQLELMQRRDIVQRSEDAHLGLCHMAFGCATQEEVRALTERLRFDGHPIVGEPRWTGDGFYESVVADPEGNLIELVYKPAI